MLSTELLLEVLPHFPSEKDAVRFIKAASLPLGSVPRWRLGSMMKLQRMRTAATDALEKKNYFRFVRLPRFDEPPPCRIYNDLAKVWLMALMHPKSPRYRRMLAGMAAKFAGDSDPLRGMILMRYFNPYMWYHNVCYMEGGSCYVSGPSSWDSLAFEELVAMMSKEISRILWEEYCGICSAFNRPTFHLNQLATRLEILHLPDSDGHHHHDYCNYNELRTMERPELREIAHIDPSGPLAKQIKHWLRQTKARLTDCCAFEEW